MTSSGTHHRVRRDLVAGLSLFAIAVGLVLALAASDTGKDNEDPSTKIVPAPGAVLADTNRRTVLEGLAQTEDALRAIEVRNYSEAREHIRDARSSLAALLASPTQKETH